MHASSHGSTGSGSSRGPAMFLGYCHQAKRYRMMDLTDYVSNMQEGMTRLMNDPASALRSYGDLSRTTTGTRPARDCGCSDCHCECCVCDADVLVHARCSESRSIPVIFENDTRRERPVKLDLGKFVTAGGYDLGWNASLSETDFTLPPCGEHTVILRVAIVCKDQGSKGPTGAASGTNDQVGRVDRCEVGYATVRAEGCLTRPVVVAVAVLPDDCDAYRHPCGCGCCH